jgi:hypothetical protein
MALPGTGSLCMSFGLRNKAVYRMLAAVTLLLTSPSVFAYLDPSTGSMIVSAIIGILASIALAAKTYWYKLKGLFRRRDRAQTDAAEDRSGEA